LERLWAAVRAAMLEQNIDVLLMQNSNSFHGGYVKYFTDIPAMSGGYQAVLFFRDEEMIAFRHGPPGESTFIGDDIQRGVQKVINRAPIPPIFFRVTTCSCERIDVPKRNDSMRTGRAMIWSNGRSFLARKP
jgi:hypothetical protein